MRIACCLLLLAWTTGCSRTDGVPPNIVVILVDTLRADHLRCYGYDRATSPNIDRLASRGVLFQDTYSVASYTKAATGTLFTGLYPSVHGAVSAKDSLSKVPSTLAETLRGAGYSTIGYILNPNVTAEFGFDRGFDEYRMLDREFKKYVRGLPAKERGLGRVDDRAITMRAVPFLQREHEGPFFLYLHFIGPHAPYAPPTHVATTTFLEGPLTPRVSEFYKPPELDERGIPIAHVNKMKHGAVALDDVDKQQIVDLYDGEIAFTDRQVGAVLDALDATGLGDNTIVVLLSDHGEEFWEHGSMTHGTSHYQELLRVPLAIAGPGIEPRRVDEPISLVDVMPTLLDLAGLEVSDELQGQSLRPLLEHGSEGTEARTIYAEGLVRFLDTGDAAGFFRSARQGDLKLILDGRKRRKYLFDLSADPAEKENILASSPSAGRELLDQLIAVHGTNVAIDVGDTERAEISSEMEVNIRALGYLGEEGDTETGSVFRRPWRSTDVDPFGFIGDERELENYRSEVDFRSGESICGEQLLYGWKALKNRGEMRRVAGIRLLREPQHREWVIRGFVPAVASEPLELTIHIDGSATEHRVLEQEGRFELRGPLPEEPRPFARLDITCKGGRVPKRGPLDEQAHALLVRSIGLE